MTQSRSITKNQRDARASKSTVKIHTTSLLTILSPNRSRKLRDSNPWPSTASRWVQSAANDLTNDQVIFVAHECKLVFGRMFLVNPNFNPIFDQTDTKWRKSIIELCWHCLEREREILIETEHSAATIRIRNKLSHQPHVLGKVSSYAYSEWLTSQQRPKSTYIPTGRGRVGWAIIGWGWMGWGYRAP